TAEVASSNRAGLIASGLTEAGIASGPAASKPRRNIEKASDRAVRIPAGPIAPIDRKVDVGIAHRVSLALEYPAVPLDRYIIDRAAVLRATAVSRNSVVHDPRRVSVRPCHWGKQDQRQSEASHFRTLSRGS